MACLRVRRADRLRIFGLLIAKPFSALLRFFPPLVTGTVIVMIGLSLIGADIGLIAGDKTGSFTAKIRSPTPPGRSSWTTQVSPRSTRRPGRSAHRAGAR